MDILQKFRSGIYHVLVAIDVAARGRDIKSIKSVVNFDIAKDMDMHVHQIGRTGRSGDKDGTAYTLITQKEALFAGELVNSLVAAGQTVSTELMDLAMKLLLPNKNAVGLVGSVELNHDIVHHILTLLPIDKCIKAHGLATRFKDSWRFARKLHFGREFVKEYRLEPMEFVDTADHVFRFYKGPKIQSFHIYVDPDHDYVARIALKKWVSKCKEKGIEELDLEVFVIERFPDYFIPSRVLDVKTLKVLKLTLCVFTLPHLGKCLSLITTLILTRVKSLNNTSKLYSITASSSKTLDMAWCEGFRDLVVAHRT
ncbi:hypothetical protein FF1_025241 [Malus domestica]